MSWRMREIKQLANYIATQSGRDLHESDRGLFAVPEWDGYPVRLYRYSKTDPDGTVKAGEVALLDASDEQIAKWISSAVEAVAGAYEEQKAHLLVNYCFDQSGFQFPVRGVHWEDMKKQPFKAFTFFDGVTVSLKGWDPLWPTRPLTQPETDFALHATWDDVDEAWKAARIQSTTREEYHSNGGKLPTEGKEWLNVVRRCYQKAWGSNTNELMTAKARALLETKKVR
jgi:hypothetical protein